MKKTIREQRIPQRTEGKIMVPLVDEKTLEKIVSIKAPDKFSGMPEDHQHPLQIKLAVRYHRMLRALANLAEMDHTVFARNILMAALDGYAARQKTIPHFRDAGEVANSTAAPLTNEERAMLRGILARIPANDDSKD